MPIHQIEYLDKRWEAASRLARDGSDWLRMGIDRQRFRDRIDRTAEILNEVLDFEFRQRVYQERFEYFVTLHEQDQTKEKKSDEVETNLVDSTRTAAETTLAYDIHEPSIEHNQQQTLSKTGRAPEAGTNKKGGSYKKRNNKRHNTRGGSRKRHRGRHRRRRK